MPADNINNNDIPYLSTSELTQIYKTRKDDADLVWGLIMMRAALYEQVCEENKRLYRLLSECAAVVEQKELKERIKAILAEQDEGQ